jgi:hypothetical protein
MAQVRDLTTGVIAPLSLAVNMDRRAGRRAEIGFAVLVVSSIYLQKLNLPGLPGDFCLDLAILWGVLLWLLLTGAANIHPMRLILFIATTCCIILSVILERGIYSLPAMVLFLFANSTVMVVVELDRLAILRCYAFFQRMMVPIAFIIVGQQIVQYTIGNAYWPNPSQFLPDAMLVHGFMYIRLVAWNSPYLIPNGIFFLEPSASSLFLATAIVIEIVWLKRFRHMCLFAFALLIGMTGTGVMMLVILSPWLLGKMDRGLRRLAIKAGIPLLLVVSATGATSYLAQRSDELSDQNSSAYGRFYVPFEQTVMLFSDPTYLLSGNGPGSTPKSEGDFVTWPSNKLAYEYSTLTSVVFHVFLLISVLAETPSPLGALASVLPTLMFGGGFMSAPNTMLMVMFGSLVRMQGRQ